MFYEELNTSAPALFCNKTAIVYRECDIINTLKEKQAYIVTSNYGTFFAKWQRVKFNDETLAVFVKDSDTKINQNHG